MNTGILYLEAAKREMFDNFLLNNTNYYYRMEDGKIDCIKRMQPDPPWAYIKQGPNQNCQFWHHVLFDQFFKRQRVPIACQNCWKVVVFPRDIEELFACYALIHELGVPGKCGSEIDRPNSPRLYGAYFYNNSLEDGLACYDLVKRKLERDKEYDVGVLGCNLKVRFNNGHDKPIGLILKRGCTEFEQACGDSSKWTFDEEQIELERIITNAFAQDVVGSKQGDYQLARVFYRWIHGAYRIGDEKYKLFTNGNEMYEPPVTYHDMDPEKLKEVMEAAKRAPR